MRSAQLMSVAFLSLASFATPQAAAQEKPKPKPDPNVAATEPLRPEEQKKKIKLPPGFELQLVAADPDIRKPININFDAAGRLWVTETIEYPYAAKPGQGRDAVKILEDFGSDGKARKITTFADKLNIPIGILPTSKGALVYSIPSIFHIADGKREVYYDGFGHDDTHGMTGEFMQGFDGWIYACHGFRNESKVKSKDGKSSIHMTSGNTYRFKADGSRIEQWTWGQVNPFGLAFDPYGNLYSGDCHSQPLTMLLRHGQYVSFNRPHDGLGFAPHMNTFGKDHSTALCGVTYYAADQYPKEYQGMLFLGDVMNNRINAYKLEWHGATPRAVMQEFLTSSDPWFRPVDIKLGPDGCLYFADFYNRIIGHYEVDLDHPGRDRDKGRIWRIVYRGKDGKSGPQPVVNLAKADVKALVAELSSPNLTVRLQATHQLVERGGDEAVKALQPIIKDIKEPGAGATKAHALWVLERLGKLDEDTMTKCASAKEKEVRVHIQRILTEKSTWSTRYTNFAMQGLLDDEPMVNRCAVDAMAAHPTTRHLAVITEYWPIVNRKDTHLFYATRLALREQLHDAKSWKALATAKWAENRHYHAVADVCLAVRNEASAEFLQSYLLRFEENIVHAQPYTHHIVRYGTEGSVGWVLNNYLKKHAANLGLQGSVLKSVAQAAQERGLKLTDADRASAEAILARVLESRSTEELRHGITAAIAMRSTKSQPRLLALASAKDSPPDLCKLSLLALIIIDAKQAGEPLTQLILDERLDPSLRGRIARDIGSTNHPEAHTALLKAMQVAPARMEFDLAYALTTSKAGTEKLLQAIAVGKAPAGCLQGRPIVLNLQSSGVNVEAYMKKLGVDFKLPAASEEERMKIQKLIHDRRQAHLSFKSDANVGQKVYQKHCANCHQIAEKGTKVGPNLDGIGARGLERLLEDVLDSNRNVDQAFRKTIITTKQGQTIEGLFLREEGKLVILADKEGKEVRIEKAGIDERTISPLSPMPSNFVEALSEPELHHLMAYLLAQRGKQ